MWISLSLAAGTLQALRNAAAQRLGGCVDPDVNSWARFTFALPLTVVSALGLGGAEPLRAVTLPFLATCLVAALAQLLANVALVAAFRRSTFAGSIALHKLEIVYTAIAGALWFSEMPSALGMVGITACGAGAVTLSLRHTPSARGAAGRARLDPGARLALVAALLLVVASFAVRRAIGELETGSSALPLGRLALPAHALMHVTWIEVVVLTAALRIRKPNVFGAVPQHLGAMSLVGAAAWASSLCWYSAFAEGEVAYVRALGQIEAAWSVIVGLAVFRQRETLRQLPALGLVTAGILGVIASTVP